MAKKYRKIKRRKIHYRRSRKKFSVLKTVLFIVLIAVLVFLAYSVAGPIKQLLTGELASSEPSASGSQSSASAVVSDVTSTTPSTPEVTETSTKAITLSQEVLLDSTRLSAFLEEAKAEGYTAVVAPLKDADGMLFYQSAVVEPKAIASNAVNAEALAKQISGAGLTPLASVHTFQDKTAPNKVKDNTFMIKDSTYTWFDKSASAGGKPWLNPYKSAARSYNTAIVEELTKAGFREIILKSVQFPEVYSMSKADLPTSPSFNEILGQYIAEAAAVAKKHQANITVSYPSVGYWTEEKVTFGGFAGDIKADRISPVIRLSEYGSKLTIGETVLENPANDPAAALKLVLAELQVRTSSTRPKIIPIVLASEASDTLLQALKSAGISDYIVE